MIWRILWARIAAVAYVLERNAASRPAAGRWHDCWAQKSEDVLVAAWDDPRAQPEGRKLQVAIDDGTGSVDAATSIRTVLSVCQ
jgi:hypothetical protein